MNTILTPDWFDKPLEEWPDAAKEFYRLVFVGMWRARFHAAYGDSAPCGDMNCPRCRPVKAAK